MKQSAVEWLVKQLPIYVKMDLGFEIIEQAKEIEKEQITNCVISTTQSCFKAAMAYLGQEIVFTEQDLINQKNEAEQYYNETFNK
jgi:hypothetical protein